MIRFVPGLALLLVSTSAPAALAPGAAAPDFTTQGALAGKPFSFSLKQALKKGPVVLYFFPAAFTPGCTIEAHEFAEATPEFAKLGATVIGMSADGIDKLQRFSVEECRNKFAVATATPTVITILLVGDLLQPIHGSAVLRLLHGDVCDRRGRGRAVPVLLAGREPDDIAGADLLDWPAPTLRPAAPRDDEQRLAERMRVPRGARTGIEPHHIRPESGRVGSLDQRVLPDRAGEPVGRPPPGRHRTAAAQLHRSSSH